jgi:hypothetical protein
MNPIYLGCSTECVNDTCEASNSLMIFNSEAGRVWKETIVVCFKIMSHISLGTLRNTTKPYWPGFEVRTCRL